MNFVAERNINDETAFDHSLCIQIDGKDVGAKNYISKPGSVQVFLKSEYLETLSLGKHTLTLLFDDGEASTNFTIVKLDKQNSNTNGNPNSYVPNTSASNWTALNLFTLCVSLGVWIVLKRRSPNK